MKFKNNLAEPLPLFGIESIIDSKTVALKVIKINSYYVFIAGFLALFCFIGSKYFHLKIPLSDSDLMLLTVIIFACGFFIRNFQSRFASIVLLVIFVLIVLLNFHVDGFGGLYVFALFFVAASYRLLKATFYYHGNNQ